MFAGRALFHATAAAVFLQLVVGGLLTFNFIKPELHIVLGLIVFILAIACLIVSFVSKPSFRPVRIASIALVVLMLVQIILGFAALGTHSDAISWTHFVNAMIVYGVAMSGNFMAVRWDQIRLAQSKSP
ncbi:MAG: hypothetical protein JRN52_15425 [Nitrososphaerota archaeon]|nr:hypothetical protein [Nitrososphaerota archaeon]